MTAEMTIVQMRLEYESTRYETRLTGHPDPLAFAIYQYMNYLTNVPSNDHQTSIATDMVSVPEWIPTRNTALIINLNAS